MCLRSLISDASEWLFQLCHEHSSDSPHQGNHPRRAPHLLSKPLFTLPPFYVNKSTLRGICLSSPCCVILPPRHSGGEYGHVKRKLSPTSDLQFLTPPPPVHLCFQKGVYSSPQDGRTSSAVNRHQPAPAPDRRTPGHPPGPGWPGNCSPADGRPPARSVTDPRYKPPSSCQKWPPMTMWRLTCKCLRIRLPQRDGTRTTGPVHWPLSSRANPSVHSSASQLQRRRDMRM